MFEKSSDTASPKMTFPVGEENAQEVPLLLDADVGVNRESSDVSTPEANDVQNASACGDGYAEHVKPGEQTKVLEQNESIEVSLELRRSSRVRNSPGSWWRAGLAMESSSGALLGISEPLSYSAAVGGHDATFWRPGIDKELESLFKNKTWIYVIRAVGINVLTLK